MMNKKTRRLSKIPEEVRGEIEPYFMNSDPVVEDDSPKSTKPDENAADIIRTGLTPRWSDFDVNQHVNNVKYIGWILESAPPAFLESHELSTLTLEYRRECGRDSVLQSLAAVSSNLNSVLNGSREVECLHLLRLETGAKIVKEGPSGGSSLAWQVVLSLESHGSTDRHGITDKLVYLRLLVNLPL